MFSEGELITINEYLLFYKVPELCRVHYLPHYSLLQTPNYPEAVFMTRAVNVDTLCLSTNLPHHTNTHTWRHDDLSLSSTRLQSCML